MSNVELTQTNLSLNTVHEGDCLVESDKIASGSVDLILTDLPYGNMNTDGGRKLGIVGWDFAIDPKNVYEIANRILRKNGKMVLFSQEPYTSQLITEAAPNVPFLYRAAWEKDNFANALGVNKNMVCMFEDVLVFKKLEGDIKHPAKEYTDKIREFINKPNKLIFDEFRAAGYKKYAVLDTFNSVNARRYNFPTKETYEALIDLYRIDLMCGFIPYEELQKVDTDFKMSYPSVFNLWDGGKYKSNILRYKKDYNGYHPTQKPVLLLEDLIKTFSNEGDTVVDLTCGSGSTLVAAINTNRNYIGIEREPEYVAIAKQRINDALVAKEESAE